MRCHVCLKTGGKHASGCIAGSASIRSTTVNLEAFGVSRPKVKAKYGNRKVVADGITFDSAAEHRRWLQLKLLQKSGAISELCHHQVFDLIVDGVLICKYEADFTYTVEGELVVEDVKSEATRKNRAYRIKKKLFEALNKRTIVEVTNV